MVGGDVVPQHRQRPHAPQGTLAGQRAFPVGRAANIGALGPPFVERTDQGIGGISLLEHGDVDLPELLWPDAGAHDGIDLVVVGPDVLERHRVALGIDAKHVALDIEADGAGDGVGHHQRRRGQERLFGIGVDTAVEVAVA